ncbi:MAG: NADP-dependent isocitrate dehydrogenase [Ruminococcaceae bacterium]|nr:NADP-dependent isocitrate dehydrogenase [Oscillospiraceae bacterium]
MAKIQMTTPLVEMDGDEMTRIIWKMIKDILIGPYVDLKTEYYDLGLVHRNETEDKVTVESAEATKKYGVAVKCATITPNAQRVEEYKLKEMWKSPNGTIRAILDGTVFRKPILVKGITPYIPTWTKPITIARHAYGDIYKNTELKAPQGSKAEIVITDKDGNETRALIHDFKSSDGIVQGVHNLDSSIGSFARACFNYALDAREDLWFASKDTISKTYDHRFKDIFAEIYESEYKAKFEAKGIEYFYTLIDDVVARVIRSEGGFIWACKNYDGDVMSDMLATAYGSLGLMTSVLVSPDGKYEYEAAHGTVTRHYYNFLKGEKTSTNPIATIFAWSGALRKRGELDGISALIDYADRLEEASVQTMEEGVMDKNLAAMSKFENKRVVDTETFLVEINNRLEKLMA